MGKRKSKIASVKVDADLLEFVAYNRLEGDDRLFFAHAGFDRFIGIACKLLANRIGQPDLYNLNKPYFSENDLLTLNKLIGQILGLIGQHTNSRFGFASFEQDRYFRRPSERQTFPSHLYISRFEETKSVVTRASARTTERIARNGDIARAYSKENFNGIPAAKKVRFCSSKLTQTELRAIGVLYMLDLLWLTVKDVAHSEQSAKRKFANLVPALKMSADLYSILDESDQLLNQSVAGKRADKKARFSEELTTIENLVKANPSLSTPILARRAHTKFGDDVIGATPSARWILDRIREAKKRLR